ncbi:dystrophin-like [Vanessa tameamea]|uniref:Dystrophin-like n=1 Tax=Vanessa tameamea TaxID=334116 RepID=A0A8B8IEJ1_VANTA|nr:dystrophin-like [Vanessa tameamea]
MNTIKWKKVENEAGYPCYIDETSGKQSYDHPQFLKIMGTLEEYNDIKYSAYRIAFKLFALQRNLQVPPLRITSGVFARHQLSLSESSLSLDTAELEAVLADIYFAAEKEGLFTGDVDLTVDLLINLLLNVYDKDRKTPIKVSAAKTLLILLSEEPIAEKWLALANCSADHNGCVSPKRLAALLVHVMALPKYLGCQCDYLQSDVDSCFEKSAGMLGVSARCVSAWGAARCASTRWLGALRRVADSRRSARAGLCAACGNPLVQVLKFRCSKCRNVIFCENCYLYDKDLSSVSGHKKTHLVHEMIDGEVKPPECLSFIKGMKRFFFCTKTKKKSSKKGRKNGEKLANPVKRKESKPAIFTSTVGKASGNKANPAITLQDVITQLENENKAIKDLTDQLETAAKNDNNDLKAKVDEHYRQISTQINRLKMLKDNLLNTQNLQADSKSDKNERPQAFDLFSPIPIVDEKQSKVTDNIKNQPRVLSMDSGNFSVASKPDSQNLLTMSGDALKPVVVHATSDSISTVSMNDMSNWYNEAASSGCAPGATVSRSARDINADLDTVLDRLQQILTHNFAMDDSCFDNTQLRETANEMEGLLGSLIRGVEQRATLTAKGLV